MKKMFSHKFGNDSMLINRMILWK